MVWRHCIYVTKNDLELDQGWLEVMDVPLRDLLDCLGSTSFMCV